MPIPKDLWLRLERNGALPRDLDPRAVLRALAVPSASLRVSQFRRASAGWRETKFA